MHSRGTALYRTAKQRIPGGTQLLSKRPEMFLPERWPTYYSRCKGISVWDLDGRKYRDFTICGVGACTLGYGDPDVDRAVAEAIKRGNMCTLNAPEEVALAELLCELHPWAQMVRYARTGGEAMAIAIRIVRAYSGKEKILFCGYHGWHDWYLAANLGKSHALDGQLLPGLEPRGVPRVMRGTAVPFHYNDPDAFVRLITRYRRELAAVVMEPVRSVWPQPRFLKTIRAVTREENIPLVFDEVTSGLRMVTGGIHLALGIMPDIAVLAKALGNGYPMAAVIGKEKVMQAAQKTFISSTYWTDRIGPAAALATLTKHRRNNAGAHLMRIGTKIQSGWKALCAKHGIPVTVTGIPPLGHWHIDLPDSDRIHTALNKGMLDLGFLTSRAFYATMAHSDKAIHSYLRALDETLSQLSPYIKRGAIAQTYPGPVAHTGFKRLT
jgi:glutamate-1-semialdehyde aminotransferase